MLHGLGVMVRQRGWLWGLLEAGMSEAGVSCFPNLTGPTLAGGRVLTPDWLPTGPGSAVGKDKMSYMLPACQPALWQPLRHPLVVLGASQSGTLEIRPVFWA